MPVLFDATSHDVRESRHSATTRSALRAVAPLLLVALIAGCSHVAGPDGPLVRVDGRVVRGPTQPVCQVDVPCDAPFSAGFTVQQDRSVLLHFRSDAKGLFTIALAPGKYLIVPDADAPLIAPEQQAKSITVPRTGAFTVELTFDTGIR